MVTVIYNGSARFSLRQIKLCEFSEWDIARSIWVSTTLDDEVSDISLTNWEFEVVGENLLEISSIDLIFISLIEELETLSGFIFSSWLVPSIADHIFDNSKINRSSFKEVTIRSLKFFILFFLAQSVEAIVVKDVSEMAHRDVAVVGFVIEIEGVLEIGLHVAWKWVRVDSRWINFSVWETLWWHLVFFLKIKIYL